MGQASLSPTGLQVQTFGPGESWEQPKAAGLGPVLRLTPVLLAEAAFPAVPPQAPPVLVSTAVTAA